MEISKKAQEIKRLYNNVKTSQRQKWQESSEIAYNFAIGNQLTHAEKTALEEKKMPTFIINKMTPQLELMKYFLTSRNPRWQAVGVDETDSPQAEIHAKMAQYVWQISHGQTVFSNVVSDALMKSVGWLKVGIDPDLDDGMGEVIVESEDPWNVIVDPHSRDPFFRDASYMMIFKDMTIEKAAIEFPQFTKEELMRMADHDRDLNLHDWDSPVPSHSFAVEDSYNREGEHNNFIKYYELYERKRVPYVSVYARIENEVQKFVMPKKSWDEIVKTEEEMPEEKRPITPHVIDVIDFFKKKVFRTECLGYKITEGDIEMPGESYPLIPLCYRHLGNPYPMSCAMDLVGKQEEINKSHQIMIHHANLSSVPRWLSEEGQISNVDIFEKQSSTPGAVLTFNPGSDGSAPQAIQPLALNNAFYQITRDGVHDMEYISGMSHYMMGQGERSGREPYRGLLAQDDFGTRRVRGFATNVLNEFMSIVGRTIDDFAKILYQTEKIINVAHPDDPELIERHVVNPISEGDIAKFHSEKSTRYNIMFVGGSTLLVNRWAELEEMLNLYEKGIVDRIAVLMKTDLGNKKGIMQRIDDIEQLSGQLQSVTEQLEKMSKNNEILERQVVNARIAAKVSDANVDINAEKDKFIMRLREILMNAEGDADRKRIEIERLISELENQKLAEQSGDTRD